MGPCQSAHNQNKNTTNHAVSQTPRNSTSSNGPFPETGPQIVNRLSNRTKFDDINKYITISDNFLGKGATGIVREGSNAQGELFAIKTVWKADVEKNECFSREIDITLDLNHESIIKCEEIYEDNSSIHLVLQLIKGGDLFDHIIHSRDRKLSEKEAIDILEQILQALHYLHDEIHVIHRDIKPENFLMYNEKGRNKIKLIDFGFACHIKPGETLTQQLGTPQYAAPEIFEEKPYTTKVDIWSTGIVLYNMINGMQPFSSNMETMKEQVLSRVIDFSGFTNPKLKSLCMGLLERDPEKRYTAIQALSVLSLLKGPDPSQQTVPSNFNPDIQKIMFILNNDRALGDELRNLFLEYFTLDQLVNLMNDILKKEGAETESGMLVGKTYLRAEKIINFAISQPYANEKLKYKLTAFKESKGEEKIKHQMINATRFFTTAIECKKFIQKQRVWHEFKKYDKAGKGYLTQSQIKSIFTDPSKKGRIVSLDNNVKIIRFELFYQIWNEYEGIKIVNSLYSSGKLNKI